MFYSRICEQNVCLTVPLLLLYKAGFTPLIKHVLQCVIIQTKQCGFCAQYGVVFILYGVHDFLNHFRHICKTVKQYMK
jgi:hypothetical protein